MALTHLQDTPINTMGNLPVLGTEAPDFSITELDLSGLTLGDLVGKTILFNISPSIGTGVCTVLTKRFNIEAAAHPDVMVASVSRDLPSVLRRFCDAEGIKRVIITSSLCSSFGTGYGVKLADSPIAGLLVRAVVIAGADGTVRYAELVEDITQDPNFEAAFVSL